MPRPGWRSARLARDRQVAYLRKALPLLVVLLGVVGILAAVLLWRWPTQPVALVVGAMGASAVWMIGYLATQASGSGPASMGAEAEKWTTQELRKLGRGWTVIDGVDFDGGDVDHVVIGPGGVFAVETKWSATDWHDGDWFYNRALDGTYRGRRKVHLLLNNVHHLGVEVGALLVLWQGADAAVPVTGALVDGIVVTHGGHLNAWRDSLPVDVLSTETAELAVAAVRERVADAVKHELKDKRGFAAWYLRRRLLV